MEMKHEGNAEPFDLFINKEEFIEWLTSDRLGLILEIDATGNLNRFTD